MTVFGSNLVWESLGCSRIELATQFQLCKKALASF